MILFSLLKGLYQVKYFMSNQILLFFPISSNHTKIKPFESPWVWCYLPGREVNHWICTDLVLYRVLKLLYIWPQKIYISRMTYLKEKNNRCMSIRWVCELGFSTNFCWFQTQKTLFESCWVLFALHSSILRSSPTKSAISLHYAYQQSHCLQVILCWVCALFRHP